MVNSLSIESVTGTALPIIGNEVDTDRIVPARFLKEVTFDRMGDYLFYDVRYKDGKPNLDHPLNIAHYSGASIMIVENNFGCGSSREHAPQAIKRAGFNAIIGESFAEIFSGNCKALGIVTCVLNRNKLDRLFEIINKQPSVSLRIDIHSNSLYISDVDISYDISIKDSHRSAFLDGTWDELALLKLNNKKIEELAQTTPYFQW